MQSNIHWPKQNFNVSTIYSCEVSYPFLPKSMFKASKPLAFILNVCDFGWDDACAPPNLSISCAGVSSLSAIIKEAPFQQLVVPLL